MSIRTEWQPRRRSVVVEPDINVTPLVDVVLVLLIIFMVVAPRMEQDIPVTLPGIFNPDPDVETHTPPILVTVTNDGEYHLEGEKHDLESTVAMLSAMHSSDPYRRLELRADAKLKYKDVREIYARVQQVGFPGMSLLVSHRYKGGDQPAAAAAPGGEAAHAETAPAADTAAPPAGDAVSQPEAAVAPAPAAPPASSDQ